MTHYKGKWKHRLKFLEIKCESEEKDGCKEIIQNLVALRDYIC